MRASTVEGKTIRRVHQRLHHGNVKNQWEIVALEFTDGSFMRFLTLEGDSDYGTQCVYPANEIGKDDKC